MDNKQSSSRRGRDHERLLLTQQEACRFLGVSRHTLFRWVAARKLPVHRLCRRVHFKRADLVRFADSRRLGARNDALYERS